MNIDKLKLQVALSCQIIANQKLDCGPFGNNSIKIPDKNEFLVNPEGIIFEQVQKEDIIRMDLDGNILEGKHKPHPGEFIHREIYRLRPDVAAIVHTHSDNTVAHSLLACEIEPYTQLGAALYGDQGIYTGFTGPVRDSNEGAAIAKALGNKAIVIAKNHGLFATGPNIYQALWDMIVADMAAKIHLSAITLGLKKAEPMSLEALNKSKIEVRHKQCEYMWLAFVNKLHIATSDRIVITA